MLSERGYRNKIVSQGKKSAPLKNSDRLGGGVFTTVSPSSLLPEARASFLPTKLRNFYEITNSAPTKVRNFTKVRLALLRKYEILRKYENSNCEADLYFFSYFRILFVIS